MRVGVGLGIKSVKIMNVAWSLEPEFLVCHEILFELSMSTDNK